MNDFITISRIINKSDIQSIVQSCSQYFYNQESNNSECIEKLSQKYFKCGRFLAVFQEDKILGFCAYYANDNDNFISFISMIVLIPDARGKGISSQLIDIVVDDCKTLGMHSIELEVADTNLRAIKFYKKKGFTIKCRKSNSSCIYFLKI